MQCILWYFCVQVSSPDQDIEQEHMQNYAVDIYYTFILSWWLNADQISWIGGPATIRDTGCIDLLVWNQPFITEEGHH